MSDLARVAVVGAGPYGLSVAAHLAAAGFDPRVFGDAMQTWREGMPSGMFLKSEGFASSLSDPGASFTLRHFCAERGLAYADTGWPVPVEVFAAYGDAFARRFVPGRDGRRVARVSRMPSTPGRPGRFGPGRPAGGFRVELEDGEAIAVGRVVLATGIGAFARVPAELAGLPPPALTHSSRHADYSGFAGRSVAVIGAGASALDAAAALRRAGASATLVSRGSAVRFYEAGPPRRAVDALLSPLTPLGPGWKKWLCCEAPQLFHALPERLRVGIVRRYLGPAPARFVRDIVEGHVPCWLNSRLRGASLASDGRVALAVDTAGLGHRILSVDHVVAATGYEVDVARLGFLDPALAAAVRTVERSPALSRDFESSVPGLYFVGTPSAYSFGPMFRFACGAGYAARRIARHMLAGERAAHRRAERAPFALHPDASRG